jgi:uncharacterized membrane protein (DUF2068 family)
VTFDRAAGQVVLGRPLIVAVIFLEKALSAIAIGAGAVLAFALHSTGQSDPLSLLIPGELSEHPQDLLVHWIQSRLPHLAPALTLWIGIGLIFWCLLLAAEAVGIWYDLLWGELLIILETMIFLPYEIWDIARHGHLTGFLSLAINLAICAVVAEFLRRRLRARAAGVNGPRWGRHAPARKDTGEEDGETAQPLRARES